MIALICCSMAHQALARKHSSWLFSAKCLDPVLRRYFFLNPVFVTRFTDYFLKKVNLNFERIFILAYSLRMQSLCEHQSNFSKMFCCFSFHVVLIIIFVDVSGEGGK